MKLNKIKEYLLKNIPKHPSDIVQKSAIHFNVSRTTIHRHLNALVNQKMVIKSGTTRQISYCLPNQNALHYKFSLKDNLSEHNLWMEYFEPSIKNVPPNIADIIHYGFTEIFNNVIDHSQAKVVEVTLNYKANSILISIHDDGIGVFKRIKQIFNFADYQECLLHLTKGKLTTDPINHSGEGLFFTARMFDKFYLIANEIFFYRDNIIGDWTMEKLLEKTKGTEIIMEIAIASQKKITDIFNYYTDEFVFNKTEILVELAKLEGEVLMSRSQAKRLLQKLEPFTSIMLDFSKVRTVGQGFVDEVFRIYQQRNPSKKIQYRNANDDVEFMIKRAAM